MPELAIEVWELFEPYLHIEAFRRNLEEIFALESIVAGARVFPTLDVVLDAHEISFPLPRDPNASPFVCDSISAELRLFDLLLPDDIVAPQPDAQVMFPRSTRFDYHTLSSLPLYQQLLPWSVGSNEHNYLEMDTELAFQVHLLELVAFMLSVEHTPI